MPTPFESAIRMSAEEFFSDYWGKQPLYVENAIPDAAELISPEDLAGLACEVPASRLVRHGADTGDWSVNYGPFDESTFANLPERDWTLLVQEVDRMDFSVNSLLDSFRCFPNWRLDDVMVSYAVPGGNVGAHVDKYDVFLIQGQGTRRWELGQSALKNPDFVEGLDLRILQHFEPDQVLNAESGDLLYLPPMFAHHGVATTECLTLSVGFRKPLVSEMVGSYLSEMLARIDSERQLGHQLNGATTTPGLLDFDLLEAVRAVFRALCYDEDSIDEWFGRYITTPKRDELSEALHTWEPDDVERFLNNGGTLVRSSASLCAFQEAPGGSVRLYVMGMKENLPSGLSGLARLLSGSEPLDKSAVQPFAKSGTTLRLFSRLVNCGFLIPAED